ncbi:MAG: OmpH family outer membrane protein [Acidobacteriota bacterium]
MSRSAGLAVAVLLLASGGILAQETPIRLGVFDPERVWKVTEVGKKYNQELAEAASRLQDDIDKKQREFEATADRLRKQRASLSEDKIQQMQREMQSKRIDLDRMKADANREMSEQLNEVQGRFQKMLIDTIEALGREKNYTLILSVEAVGYYSPEADITPEVIAKFNEMHKVPAAAVSP